MDHSLRFRIDVDGTRLVICAHCTDEVPEQQLAVDPVDGLYWDVCAPCKRKEEEQSS